MRVSGLACPGSARIAVAAVTLALAAAANPRDDAAEIAALTIAVIDAPDWSARDVRFVLDGAGAELRIATLTLPDPAGVLEAVHVHCARIVPDGAFVTCPTARLRATRDDERLSFDAALGWSPARSALRVRIPRLEVGDGELGLSGEFGARAYALELDARDVPLALIARAFAAWPADVTVSAGRAHGELRLARTGARAEGRAELEITGLAFNDESGRIAGEGIVSRTVLDLYREPGGAWQATLESGIGAGGAYAEPVYLDFSRYPLALGATLRADPTRGTLEVSEFDVEQPELARLSGTWLATRDAPLARLSLAVERAALPGAYDAWLQGALLGTPFDRLDLAGEVVGRLEVANGRPTSVEARLAELDLEDRDGRFALYGADGAVHWHADPETARDSRLAFAGGFVYGAGFDGSELAFRLAAADGALLEPARIPLLGGALRLQRLSARDWDTPNVAIELEAEVEPIELRQLTLALDWPAFGGTLSGRLPLLSYGNGVVTLGGSLEAKAFDGDVRVESLRVNRPFGVVPEIAATVRMRNLDLGMITNVVPFGSVSGRLDADIEGLRMLKGEPIAFDARFRTPEGDSSKRRISQRAIGTISRVAGGGGAVLSNTFLSVFRSFPYKRLGISCRLENDVCHMDGIAPADAGYYIVEGALLPRLNLIGRVREVNWSRLMAQLEQALAEGEFEID